MSSENESAVLADRQYTLTLTREEIISLVTAAGMAMALDEGARGDGHLQSGQSKLNTARGVTDERLAEFNKVAVESVDTFERS